MQVVRDELLKVPVLGVLEYIMVWVQGFELLPELLQCFRRQVNRPPLAPDESSRGDSKFPAGSWVSDRGI